jgi:hypothetical protein
VGWQLEPLPGSRATFEVGVRDGYEGPHVRRRTVATAGFASDSVREVTST